MTDAELVLVEEIVARLRDGLPIHDIAPALDPSLVELATALAGEMSEVGWVAGQAVPGGFDAVWQSVAVLGGVGASGAAAASIGGTAGAGGGVASSGAIAGGGVAGGGASAGGLGGAITGIIGGVGGTTAAIAGTAVVASAVVAAVLLTTPDEQPPPDDPPVVASPDLPGDEFEPRDLPSPGPPATDVEESEPAEQPTDEDTVEDEPADPSDDGEPSTDTGGATDGAPPTTGQAPDTPTQSPSPPSPPASPSPSPPSTPPSDPGPSRPVPPAPDPPTQPDPAPPVARSVTTTVVSREPTPIDVLANDQGPEVPLDRSTLTVVSQPSNGSTSIANGRVTYRSARLWLGTDTFTYRICDLAGRCAQADVKVTTTRRVETSTATLPSPAPKYTFSLGSHRDPDSAEFVELGGGRVDRLGHNSWRWLGPPGKVDYPVTIVGHLANTDGTMIELRMTLNRGAR